MFLYRATYFNVVIAGHFSVLLSSQGQGKSEANYVIDKRHSLDWNSLNARPGFWLFTWTSTELQGTLLFPLYQFKIVTYDCWGNYWKNDFLITFCICNSCITLFLTNSNVLIILSEGCYWMFSLWCSKKFSWLNVFMVNARTFVCGQMLPFHSLCGIYFPDVFLDRCNFISLTLFCKNNLFRTFHLR